MRMDGFIVVLGFAALATATLADGAKTAQDAHDFRKVIASARAKVQPAVLYLSCRRENTERGRRTASTVSGSAFVISEDGEFVTNWHVVDKATSIRCLLSDGRHFEADCLGSDKSMDVALCKLRLKEGEKVPTATFGSSAGLDEGQFVIAMGAPWGLNRSVTFGAISCARRYLDGNSEYVLWIQTDAAIGPGNSGGPLVNTEGEVIGINALGSMLPTANFGFAIPSDEAALVLDQLRRHGRVNWSWTGLQLQPLRDFERNMYDTATEGVIVAGTEPDSPARRAGLLSRDRIVRINGTAVTGLTEEALPGLRRWVGLLPDTEEMRIELVRNNEPVAVTLAPRAKGAVEGAERAFKRWDFSAKAINKFETPALFMRRPEGVYVFGMTYPGNAGDSDLRYQDIIVAVDGADIRTLDDLETAHKKALAHEGTPQRVQLTVIRNGRTRQLVLDFSRDFQRE